MTIPVKRLLNGFEMPIFGLGTWQMGGRKNHNLQNNDEADILAIRQAIKEGITHIDSAESYANGYTEELVGRAIQGYARSSLFIASKVKPENLHYNDVLTAAMKSLKRLQVEYLDLYYIHQPNPEIDIKETMQAMDYLKAQGYIKNIAVSNFTQSRLEEAQAATQNTIVANQLHFNLIYREPERKGLVEYCQSHDIMLVAWRPLQKGLILQGNTLLQDICTKYDKTPSQIAINWLISQKNVVTLSKMGSQEHLEENLGALGWEMTKDDREKLDKEFPGQQDISDSVPLL